ALSDARDARCAATAPPRKAATPPVFSDAQSPPQRRPLGASPPSDSCPSPTAAVAGPGVVGAGAAGLATAVRGWVVTRRSLAHSSRPSTATAKAIGPIRAHHHLGRVGAGAWGPGRPAPSSGVFGFAALCRVASITAVDSVLRDQKGT